LLLIIHSLNVFIYLRTFTQEATPSKINPSHVKSIEKVKTGRS